MEEVKELKQNGVVSLTSDPCVVMGCCADLSSAIITGHALSGAVMHSRTCFACRRRAIDPGDHYKTT